MAGGAAGPLSLAATGLSVAGTLFQGSTQASNALTQGNMTGMSDAYRASSLEREATYGQIKAAQTDAFMRDSLAGSLANIRAVRASADASSSPTEAAILNRAQAVGDTARTQKVANINEQVQSDRDASAFYAAAGMSAIQAGQRNARNIDLASDLSAGGQLLSAGSQANWSGIGSSISGFANGLANLGVVGQQGLSWT
ncbi:MAG: hypothetical protein JO051_03450 [Acidobacteriaceae bacterium]|nr:hypothetical protein [Acidobacteriaceae bacterium]